MCGFIATKKITSMHIVNSPELNSLTVVMFQALNMLQNHKAALDITLTTYSAKIVTLVCAALILTLVSSCQ